MDAGGLSVDAGKTGDHGARIPTLDGVRGLVMSGMLTLSPGAGALRFRVVFPLTPWAGMMVPGSVPMFFYPVHFPVLLCATVLIRSVTGAPGIALACAAWFAAVASLHPLCSRYRRLKKESPRPWIKYI
jgi:hypothetical protein